MDAGVSLSSFLSGNFHHSVIFQKKLGFEHLLPLSSIKMNIIKIIKIITFKMKTNSLMNYIFNVEKSKEDTIKLY